MTTAAIETPIMNQDKARTGLLVRAVVSDQEPEAARFIKNRVRKPQKLQPFR